MGRSSTSDSTLSGHLIDELITAIWDKYLPALKNRLDKPGFRGARMVILDGRKGRAEVHIIDADVRVIATPTDSKSVDILIEAGTAMYLVISPDNPPLEELVQELTKLVVAAKVVSS